MHEVLEPCAALAAAREAATCAGESRASVEIMAPKSGDVLQEAFVTDESRSC